MVNKQQLDEFNAFLKSCIWLRHCYNTFNHLYGSGPDTEAALTRAAPAFFGDLNTILQEYFFLQVRKISDPATSRTRNAMRENLTVPNINESLTRAGVMTTEISALSARILAFRSLTLDISNRVGAHADKLTALAPGLVGAHSAGELEAFMEDIQSYTDAVGVALGAGPLDYKSQAGTGDVLDLIRILKRV